MNKALDFQKTSAAKALEIASSSGVKQPQVKATTEPFMKEAKVEKTKDSL